MSDHKELDDDLRPEYDETLLKNGVRGKYYRQYQKGNNLVLLEPEIAKAFPDEKSVNDALRLLLQIAKTATSPG